jgi:hypothetical protein
MRRNSTVTRRAAALVAGGVLATATAVADAAGGSSDWQFGAMIYGWLPSVSGNLNYALPRDTGGGSVSVDADKVLDALQFTLMASFEVRKGDWSVFTDVIYLDLADDQSQSVTLPRGRFSTVLDADLELTGWVWTLAGGYTVWRQDRSNLDLFAGARLLALDTDLKLTGAGPFERGRKLSSSVDLWDGIVGATGRVSLSDRWFVPYYGDIGAGGSDSTWQVAAGVGYAFEWGDVMLLYRHLEYDQGDDDLLKDVSFGGGMLGVNFRF